MKQDHRMKTIEQLEFGNIVLIDRYLNDELGPEESRRFERRLSMDNDLRIDFKNVVESYRKDYKKLGQLKKSRLKFDDFDPNMAYLRRKAGIGQRIVNYGLMAALFSILLMVVCGVVVALFS